MSQQTIGVSIPLSIIPREQELYKIGQNREMPTVDIHNKPRFRQQKETHIINEINEPKTEYEKKQRGLTFQLSMFRFMIL